MKDRLFICRLISEFWIRLFKKQFHTSPHFMDDGFKIRCIRCSNFKTKLLLFSAFEISGYAPVFG